MCLDNLESEIFPLNTCKEKEVRICVKGCCKQNLSCFTDVLINWSYCFDKLPMEIHMSMQNYT